MKKHIFLLSAAVTVALLSASCSKERETLPRDSVELAFVTDDGKATKSSSTSSLALANGCTVAFYSKSTGALAASASCEGSTNRIVIEDVPSGRCDVYAVGNTSFVWPEKKSELASRGIPINVVSGAYIPRSTREGDYEWKPGTTHMEIEMKKMYSTVRISRNQPDSVSFTATSARILNCPDVIYPFGAASSGTSGTTDTATPADLELFNNGQEFLLYVPSEGESVVELKGTRKSVSPETGDGISRTDTYTITVPAANRQEEVRETVMVNGTDGGQSSVIVVTFPEDTRSVTFGKSTLKVMGAGTAYSSTVKGRAANGETGWTYSLSWDGNSALGGTTTISVDGGAAQSLGTAGTISDLPGDGESHNIAIVSSYAGDTLRTVRLTSSVNNSYMDIAVSKDTRVLSSITATYSKNNPDYSYIYNCEIWPDLYGKAVVTARYSDGSSENISGKTSDQGLTISSDRKMVYKNTPEFVMLYPREDFFKITKWYTMKEALSVLQAQSVTQITFTYKWKGITKTASISDVRCGPVIKKLEIWGDLAARKELSFESGGSYTWVAQNPEGYYGGMPSVRAGIIRPATYDIKDIQIYLSAVTSNGESFVIFGGGIRIKDRDLYTFSRSYGLGNWHLYRNGTFAENGYVCLFPGMGYCFFDYEQLCACIYNFI